MTGVALSDAQLGLKTIRQTEYNYLLDVLKAAKRVELECRQRGSWFDHLEHKGACVRYEDPERITDALETLAIILEEGESE